MVLKRLEGFEVPGYKVWAQGFESFRSMAYPEGPSTQIVRF